MLKLLKVNNQCTLIGNKNMVYCLNIDNICDTKKTKVQQKILVGIQKVLLIKIITIFKSTIYLKIFSSKLKMFIINDQNDNLYDKESI